MAAISSVDGSLGPRLQRCGEEEKSRRYVRVTKAWWNLSSVAGLTTVPSFLIRHEQRGQSEHAAIECGQIQGAASRAITDQGLLLEQQRSCDDGAQATGAQQVQEGDQQGWRG